MATRDTPWPPGTPCWVDLTVADVGTARLFYEGLFGWQLIDPGPEAMGYLMALRNGRQVAGIGPKLLAYVDMMHAPVGVTSSARTAPL